MEFHTKSGTCPCQLGSICVGEFTTYHTLNHICNVIGHCEDQRSLLSMVGTNFLGPKRPVSELSDVQLGDVFQYSEDWN